MEQIYTIPVNEAFDASEADHACGCPLCSLYNKLQENELELILGASMMEPDVRQKTNVQGFCHRHYNMMLGRKNRLGLTLIMESHLAKVEKDVKAEGLQDLLSGTGKRTMKKLNKLEESCYICERIETNLDRMTETVLFLYRQDMNFRRKLAAQPYFCLPHYNKLLTLGKKRLTKKEFDEFYAAISAVEKKYIASLREDVSWFCKKFDYRYADEPWNNAKDAPERAILFLSGNTEGGESKK